MTQYYWHFTEVDSEGVPCLGFGDGREVRVGKTLTVEGEPVLCEHGLLGGTVKHDTGKSVANERTPVAMLDATTTKKLLRDFARWCALQVIHLWNAPDVVKKYLETGDESLRAAARAAAWDAAWESYADELERRALTLMEGVTA